MAADEIYPTGPIHKLMQQISNLRRFKRTHRARFDTLTKRERTILAYIAKGMNNPAIAEKCEITRATVQNHRAQIRDKLNINHQVDFVKYALAYELIEF